MKNHSKLDTVPLRWIQSPQLRSPKPFKFQYCAWKMILFSPTQAGRAEAAAGLGLGRPGRLGQADFGRLGHQPYIFETKIPDSGRICGDWLIQNSKQGTKNIGVIGCTSTLHYWAAPASNRRLVGAEHCMVLEMCLCLSSPDICGAMSPSSPPTIINTNED